MAFDSMMMCPLRIQTFVPRAESQIVVLGEILEAGVHPIDADARPLEIPAIAIIVEIGRDAVELARNDLFGALGATWRRNPSGWLARERLPQQA
jgi:hypothetical protein